MLLCYIFIYCSGTIKIKRVEYVTCIEFYMSWIVKHHFGELEIQGRSMFGKLKAVKLTYLHVLRAEINNCRVFLQGILLS